MQGTRPLKNDDIRRVSACFDGIFEARNRDLFMLAIFGFLAERDTPLFYWRSI